MLTDLVRLWRNSSAPMWFTVGMTLAAGPAYGQLFVPVAGQVALGQPPSATDTAGKRATGIRLSMEEHPTVRLGSIAEIRIKGRLDSTARTPTPDEGRETADYAWKTRRLELEGEVLGHLEFEFSREFGDTQEPERDAFVNLRMSRALQVQTGHFKVPFGHDALTGGANLDFVYRSLAGRQLAPGRDVGLMVHGRVLERTTAYEVGYFRRDGDNARTSQTRGARDAFAARVVVTPFASRRNSPLEGVEIGGAIIGSALDHQLGLRGRTVFGEGVFFDRVFVNGRRLRLGCEAVWALGPVSLSGEYVAVADQRSGMGLRGEALPDVRVTGWYLAGTWVLTGEKKRGRVDPRRSLLQGGFGAIEVAARVERLGFTGVSHPGTAFEGPRPEDLARNAERVTTVGLSWYLNRFVKVQGNAVFEIVDDPQRSPAPRAGGRFPSGVFLFQFAL